MLLLKKTKPIRYEKKKLWEVVLIVYWLCGLLKYPYYKCDNWLFIKKIIARTYLQMFTFFQVLK